MYKVTTLPNKLKIISAKIEGTKAVTALILVGAGSRYETKEINGISHFLEHMFFKGAKTYKNTREVSEAIDGAGGEFNAFTGKEYAGYYVKIAKQNLNTALDVLSDMMLNSKFAPEEIEKERGVILEEFNMYLDTPMYQVGWNFEKLMYGDQPLGWDQIGTKELIKGVQQKDFQEYKNALYTPDNIVIALSGAIEHEEAVAKIQQYFKFQDKEKSFHFKRYLPQDLTKKIHLKNKKTEQAHLVLGVEGLSAEDEDIYIEKLLAVILGGNMSSRMFLNVREAQGLAYYIQTTTDDYLDTGILSTRAGVDVTRVEAAVKAILKEYQKITEENISEKELKKAKEYLKGKIILSFEDSEEVAHFYAKQSLLYQESKNIDEVLEKIEKITVAEINRIAKKLLQKEKMKLAIIGPYQEKDKTKFEKLLNNLV